MVDGKLVFFPLSCNGCGLFHGMAHPPPATCCTTTVLSAEKGRKQGVGGSGFCEMLWACPDCTVTAGWNRHSAGPPEALIYGEALGPAFPRNKGPDIKCLPYPISRNGQHHRTSGTVISLSVFGQSTETRAPFSARSVQEAVWGTQDEKRDAVTLELARLASAPKDFFFSLSSVPSCASRRSRSAGLFYMLLPYCLVIARGTFAFRLPPAAYGRGTF
ncbi:hypothetical protein BDP67DRAFT_261641 [Colletotrichum lupini]|nr:hypothetical protein BDP67DRAFT_261641 [Colletotrichum lupini]